MDRPAYSVQRDRLGPYLARLADKLLRDPTPQTVRSVGTELQRLANG